MTVKELIEKRLAEIQAAYGDLSDDPLSWRGVVSGLRNALDLLAEADAVELAFDHAEAKGVVRLTRGAYGANILVNDDLSLGYVDLFHLAFPEGDANHGPAQLILDHQTGYDPPVYVELWPEKLVLQVDKECGLEFAQTRTESRLEIPLDPPAGRGPFQ